MKQFLLTLGLFATLTASAQVPQIINYQGRITVGGTNYDATGSFKFALVNTAGTANYWANDGTASGQPATGVSLAVSKGLYSVLLGDTTVSGMTVAIGSTVFNNSDVRLRVWFSDGSGYQQLTPDQRIAAVGYALVASTVSDGSVTAAKLATGAVTPAKLDTTGATSGQVLTYNGSVAAWAAPSGGSSYTAGSGLTLSGSAFSITSGGVTSTHLASGSVGASQIASGAVGATQLATGAVGATQLGSGAVTSAKLGSAAVGSTALDLTGLTTVLWKAGGNSGTTAGTHFLGTTDNVALQIHVNGTRALRLEPNTNGAPNVIGGSPLNYVASGVMGATIGGGGATNYSGNAYSNSVTARFGTIAGGAQNLVNVSGIYGTIGGGQQNEVSLNAATVGGGFFNLASGFEATIGGGQANVASGSASFVGGGATNLASGFESVVAGGEFNAATGTNAFVGAGYYNVATNFAVVVGGYANLASGKVAFVGGGTTNYASGFESAVVGGEFNAATGTNAFVGAGYDNGATNFASVVGGYANFAGGKVSFVGGGTTNYATGFESAVVGGELNAATATNAFVGGGYNNGATNVGATVAGGTYNLAGGTVSTISGGYYNGASGYGATVPGGYANSAAGSNSLAAGYVASAAHAGAFVWSDMSSSTAFASTAPNQFNVRAAGGVRMVAGTTTATLVTGVAGWSVTSDRNAKKDFAPVDGREVLRKLDEVPVQSWRYKWDEAGSTPHLGPIAQEFKAAFYPGRDDKSISTLEFDGVELAAIQGLHTLVKEKDAKISALEQRLADLEAKVSKLVK